MAEDRDDGPIPDVLKAFRENLKLPPQTLADPVAIGSFLVARMACCTPECGAKHFWTLLTAVLIGAAVLYGIVLLYAFSSAGTV